MNGKTFLSIVIPTPFGRYPFEFLLGFRNGGLIGVIFYYTTAMSIIHDNFSLGAVSLACIYLICIFFYTQKEDVFYIWQYNISPKLFLWKKIKVGIKYSTIASLPIFIGLSFFMPTKIVILLLIIVAGYLYFIAAIIAKYAIVSRTSLDILEGFWYFIIVFIIPPIITIPILLYIVLQK